MGADDDNDNSNGENVPNTFEPIFGLEDDQHCQLNRLALVRASVKVWRHYRIRVKYAWKNQANNLNQLPVDGLFDNPQYLMESNHSLENNVIHSLYKDLKKICTRI